MTITAGEHSSVRSTMKDPNIARRYEALVDLVAGEEEHLPACLTISLEQTRLARRFCVMVDWPGRSARVR